MPSCRNGIDPVNAVLAGPLGLKGRPAGDGRCRMHSKSSTMATPGTWSADWAAIPMGLGGAEGRQSVISPPIGPGEVAE